MHMPDPLALLVASLIADPGVTGSIPARPHTFMSTNQEIFSRVILLLIQEGLLSVTCKSMYTEYCNRLG